MDTPPCLNLPRAVLFDLDGTLADTAPDLAAALNLLRANRGLAPAPYENLRKSASSGARGLIGAGFGLDPDDLGFESLKDEFLAIYEAELSLQTCLFPGIASMLEGLRGRGVQWGIVTNKAARFTDRLVPEIGLGDAWCVISGDTTPHPKPHPAPLLEAARRLGLEPSECWYVGDDLRDIQAGRAAGMLCIAAGWGYAGDVAPKDWDADLMLATPLELLELLR